MERDRHAQVYVWKSGIAGRGHELMTHVRAVGAAPLMTALSAVVRTESLPHVAMMCLCVFGTLVYVILNHNSPPVRARPCRRSVSDVLVRFNRVGAEDVARIPVVRKFAD